MRTKSSAFVVVCFLMSAMLANVGAIEPDVEILNPLSGETPSRFGTTVAVDGDRMLVGAPDTPNSDLDNAGAVRVYTRDGSGTWQLETTLQPDTPEANLNFGGSVAISGDTAIVGTPDSMFRDDWGRPEQALYVFVRDGSGNWTQQAKLSSDATITYKTDQIAISGDTLAVRASQEIDGQNQNGIFIYTRDGSAWTQEAIISSDDTLDGRGLGSDFALSGDRLAVVVLNTYSNPTIFAAHVFERQSPGVWTQIARPKGTHATGPQKVDLSGDTLALTGYIHVYGHYEDDGGTQVWIDESYTPVASVFRDDSTTSWTEEASIEGTLRYPRKENNTDRSGVAIRVATDTLLCGEWIDITPNACTARLYERATDGTWSLAANLDNPTEGIDNFGFSVALAGDQAIVGAPFDDTVETAVGAVHVYERQTDATWTYQESLYPFTDAGGDAFGYAVAMSDDLAIVGAPFAADTVPGSGCARIYAQDSGGSWTQVTRLVSPNPEAYDMFGNSVAINASTALVASVHEGIETDGSGAAYIFTRAAADTWNWQTRLTGAEAAPLADFGANVALNDDTALIAAPNDTVTTDGDGAAYVFTRNGASSWSQSARLASPNPGTHDFFASALSLDGDTAVIGCARENAGETRSGAVYVYENDGSDNWNLQARIENPTPAYYDYFGAAVCVSSDTLMVGCVGDDPQGSASGSVYVYKRDGASSWTLETQITPPDGEAFDNFGAAIAISEGWLLIASPRAAVTHYEQYAGAYYVYRRNLSGDWAFYGKMRMPGGQPGGSTVPIALDGPDALAGVPFNDEKARDAGAAHFLYVPVQARSYFDPTQTVYIESDGSFYAMAVNLTAGGTPAQLNATGTGALSFALTPAEWVGAYIYDYSTSQWVEAQYYLKQTLE